MIKNFKTILSVAAIYFVTLVSKANAQTTPTILETRNHCKLIENRSRVVINYRDTLQVYGIDTLKEGGRYKIICDLGPKNIYLIYDMDFYKNCDWVPSGPIDDSIFLYKLNSDLLLYMYKLYNNTGDERKRDSVEQRLLELRHRAHEYAQKRQETSLLLFRVLMSYSQIITP